MAKNKKFLGYAIILGVLGILFNFMYSGLQNDQINIIQAFSAWDSNATTLPLTVGNLITIPFTMIYGTLFIKFGVKKVLIPCLAISALGCIGIAAANGLASLGGEGNYALYFISLMIIRVSCACFQLSGFQLIASWFIRFRGRMLGVITLGSPLFSVVGTSVMTTFITNKLGGDYRPFYVGIAVILIVIAVVVALLIKNTPEDVDLFPDGSDTKPKSEAVEEVKLSIKDVLSQKKTWCLIVSFAIFQFIINACMASMVTWFSYLVNANEAAVAAGPLGEAYAGMAAGGMGHMVLFVNEATTWLSVGALLGIPMSYIFGWLDDKIGSIKTCILLGFTELLPIIGLVTQASAVANTGHCSVPLLILWGFGVACMTGGVPTMHPSSMSYVYGRREYQAANRIVMTIQIIPMAFSAMIYAGLINAGLGVQAWIGLMIADIVGIIFLIPLLKVPDANLADRDYGKKNA